jgi:hypothetical protein
VLWHVGTRSPCCLTLPDGSLRNLDHHENLHLGISQPYKPAPTPCKPKHEHNNTTPYHDSSNTHYSQQEKKTMSFNKVDLFGGALTVSLPSSFSDTRSAIPPPSIHLSISTPSPSHTNSPHLAPSAKSPTTKKSTSPPRATLPSCSSSSSTSRSPLTPPRCSTTSRTSSTARATQPTFFPRAASRSPTPH